MGSGGAAPADLVLKAACEACGGANDLCGTPCRHTTLCRSCGTAMARARGRCAVCAAPVTTLIREYSVRVDTAAEKAYSIGRFSSGLLPLSKKRSAGSRWSLRKEGPQGRQLTGNMREKYYSRKPWILEDETGEYQYQGQTEGSQSSTATYYLLIMHDKEINAVPVGSWYNFSKIAQYKQLTLEEAEEKMNRRRSSASGYERWMMKVAANGAAAFSSDVKKLDDVNGGTKGGVHPRKGEKTEDGDQSDKGEDEEGGTARKNRHGLNAKGMEDEEEGGKDRDFDLDDEIEKGDDWEHEETFTDDDEALDIDTEERPDLADTDVAPPKIKQDDNENEHGDGGSSNLSKSGQELKKLLRRAAGLESDDDDKDTNEDGLPLPVHGPKEFVQPKSEPEDIKPTKSTLQHAQNITPAFKSIQKRKPGGEVISNNAAPKKMKMELETKIPVIKVETPSLEPASGASLSASATNSSPITEEEIRTVLLLAGAPITSQDLVSKFKSRLRTQEDKTKFAAIVTKISYMSKTKGGNHIFLRGQFK